MGDVEPGLPVQCDHKSFRQSNIQIWIIDAAKLSASAYFCYLYFYNYLDVTHFERL
jgi:hypothetical protein